MKLLSFFKLKTEYKKIFILTIIWTIIFIFLKTLLSLSLLLKISQSKLHFLRPASSLTIDEIIYITNLSFKNVISPRCLIKSFVLRKLLFNFAKNTKLKIGIRKINNNLESHAWIEIDGKILNNEAVADYKLIYSED